MRVMLGHMQYSIYTNSGLMSTCHFSLNSWLYTGKFYSALGAVESPRPPPPSVTDGWWDDTRLGPAPIGKPSHIWKVIFKIYNKRELITPFWQGMQGEHVSEIHLVEALRVWEIQWFENYRSLVSENLDFFLFAKSTKWANIFIFSLFW